MYRVCRQSRVDKQMHPCSAPAYPQADPFNKWTQFTTIVLGCKPIDSKTVDAFSDRESELESEVSAKDGTTAALNILSDVTIFVSATSGSQ